MTSPAHARVSLTAATRESHGEKYTVTTAVVHCGGINVDPTNSTRNPERVTCPSCLRAMLKMAGVTDTRVYFRHGLPTLAVDEDKVWRRGEE